MAIFGRKSRGCRGNRARARRPCASARGRYRSWIMGNRIIMSRVITAILIACALLGFAQVASAAAPGDPRLAERMLGDAKAPVRIDEYASLSCPHCAAFDT